MPRQAGSCLSSQTLGVMNTSLRDATASESGFAFAAKREALGPYVEERWGWNDKTQQQFHNDRWSSRPWQIILLNDAPIGTVSLGWQPDHLRFGEFYLLRAYHRLGIGTQILRNALFKADTLCIETRLEHLKWNPVASLYARHGFKRIGESDTHYFLVRPPNDA